ncbi:MAG: hypothetical protein AB1555_18395, partial [Nitrospirota bacterium]
IAGGPSEAWHIAQTTAKSGLKTLSAGVNDDKAIKSRRPERSLAYRTDNGKERVEDSIRRRQ